MTRDNALYILIGLLAGFISGFFVYEVVVERQAPRAGALERFRSAREMDPQPRQSLYNQITVHAFYLGRMDRANELLEELRRLQPGNPDVERLATELERRAGGQIGTAS